MISHFFIDRPIFAAVLSIVITVMGALALLVLPIAQYPEITPPSVQVSMSYPGASAQVVADTVAAPVEQQVNGVPGMLYMSSQAGNDGSYTLTVTFDLGTDLNTALVMVQNRVTLAQPQLPESVQFEGITIRKKTPDILLVINFYSPDGRYDNIYLSNYAYINVRDEILRLKGISDVNVFGERDYAIRAWLDPQKMAALNIAATDVVAAITSQNTQASPGQIGQPPARSDQSAQLPLDTLGRLSTPEQFGDIVLKTAVGGNVQRSSVGTATALPTSNAPNTDTNGMPTITPPTGTPGTGPALVLQLLTNGVQAPGMATGPTTVVPGGVTTNSPTNAGITGAGTGAPGTSSGSGSSSGSSSGSGTNQGNTTIPAAGTSQPSMAMPSMAMPDTGSVTGSASASSGATSAAGIATPVPYGGPVPGVNAAAWPMRPATSVVHLRDVARVQIGAATYTNGCTFDGKPSAGLAIHQLPGSNALDAANRVRAKMEELKKRFPDGLEYDIAYDTTPYIRESVWDVARTLLEAVGLVALVVLIFLQNWRAALIPLIAVPVAIIGTFAAMAALHFSLNNISLFGLVLAIGIVVDDAVVVVENVERWLDQGLEPREAARKAMDEVTGPVIAIGLVLCAVFVPCAFIPGIPGQFFRQFAVTISVSTAFSAINSLTLSPALAALLLKPRNASPDWLTWLLNLALGWLFRAFNWTFGVTTTAYSWAVGRLVRGSLLVLGVYAGLVALTYFVFTSAPTGFVPDQDQGRLIVGIQLPDSASLDRTNATIAEVETIIRADPAVAHTVSAAGMSLILSTNSSNFGTVFVILKPFDQRQAADLGADAVAARLRKKCAAIQDGTVTVFGAPPIPGLSVASGFKLMVEDRGALGTQPLQTQTDALTADLQRDPNLVGVFSQFRANTPQLYMDVDRTKVASLGVALGDVNQTMQIYLGSADVNNFNAFGRDWHVVVQAEGRYRAREEDVNLLYVRNSQGEMVPLGTLVRLRPVNGPVSIIRYNLYTAAPITGTLRPGASSGDAINTIDADAQRDLPRSMSTEWTELMYMQIKAGNTAIYVFFLAVLMVFLALAALYESWSLPLAVILVVPLCLLCSVGGVLLMHLSVDIFVQIGLVVLVGLACKNAILIVEFAQHLRQQGKERTEAAVEASRLRLRPILMTSFAFILGVVPLVIATGAGAEMRRSLGTAVFAGMVGVTLFGIFLTPVFFALVQWLGEFKPLASASTLWVGSPVVGAGLGTAVAFLLWRIGAAPLVLDLPIGILGGAALGLLIPILRRQIGPLLPGQTPFSERDGRP